MTFKHIFLLLPLLSLAWVACSGGDGTNTQTSDVKDVMQEDVPTDLETPIDTLLPDLIEATAADTMEETATELPADIGVEVSTTVEDPAPQFTTAGSYTDGSACPSIDMTAFEIDAGSASSYTFTGTVTDAVGDGRFFVAGPGDARIDGPVPTVDGDYAVTIPLFCGLQTIKLVWENSTCRRVVVLAVTREECADVDIQLTLTWDAAGLDWELHLIKEGGQINDNATDCTWTSMNPDWGVVGDATDNPRKDVDDTGAYGPENIYYSNPENGTYTVMVEHWKNGSPDSDGELILNVAGALTIIPITDLAFMHVRTVATIAWPSGIVTPMNVDYDCSGTWNSGCKADIP